MQALTKFFNHQQKNGAKMSDLRTKSLLTTRVTRISIGCIVINMGWLLCTVKHTIRNWQYNELKFCLMCNVIGMIISILLCVGAMKDKAMFLVPFILLMGSALVALSVILIFCAGIYIMFLCTKFTIESLVLPLVIIIPILILAKLTYWMFENTLELFKTIRKIPLSQRGNDIYISNIEFDQTNVALQNSNGEETYGPAHNATLQDVVDIPIFVNLNDDTEVPGNETDPPPMYNESMSKYNVTNHHLDMPPSYQEAITMKNELTK